MRIVLQQVDLDTCLTGLLLGAGSADDVTVARDGATPAELADPNVLCIEAGGSGETDRNNFDHHATCTAWPPACEQALRVVGSAGSRTMERLVEYVVSVDLGHASRAASDNPGLSSLFSGMRLTVRDPVQQFFTGLSILSTVLSESVDPWGPVPPRPEWKLYQEAQARERALLKAVEPAAERLVTRQGRQVGFLRTDRVGALGALYRRGCAIGIAYAQAFRPPAGGKPIRKFTIGGRDGVRVDRLLGPLSERETGWGGPAHGTIIASPRGGTRLDPEEVRRLVCKHL